MLIYEYKLAGNKYQYAAIDEALRVVQFIRNKCLRLWMDERGISKNDLQCYCAQLAREYSFDTTSTLRPARLLLIGPGSLLPASTITVSTTSQARRDTPAFSAITGASSTSRRDGN